MIWFNLLNLSKIIFLSIFKISKFSSCEIPNNLKYQLVFGFFLFDFIKNFLCFFVSFNRFVHFTFFFIFFCHALINVQLYHITWLCLSSDLHLNFQPQKTVSSIRLKLKIIVKKIFLIIFINFFI